MPPNGRIAQLEEHLPYTQAVAGSNPAPITNRGDDHE